MGMFDTVYGNCPSCGLDVQLQSKAGDCVLDNFSIDSVPIGIAKDLMLSRNEWNTVCSGCGGKFRLMSTVEVPDRVRCHLITEEEFEARMTKLGKILYEE